VLTFQSDSNVNTRPLVLFRIAFGSVLVVLVARYFLHGWIDAQFHAPRTLFPWPGFEGVRPWPRPWMHVHFAALGLLAAGLAAGLFTRACAALFCAGFTYVHLIDRTTYLNHYYLVSLMTCLLAFLPLGKAGSLDVHWGLVRGVRSFPAWVPAILRFQVGAVYVFAGIAKLQGDWLLRAQPLRLWLSTSAGGLLAEPWVAFAMSWAGAAFDLALPALLLVRRTRPAAFALAVVFHAATALLFPIGLFPWIMLACLLVFREAAPVVDVPPARRPRFVGALLATYALVQVVVPLRHWMWPGDVLWTEEGFRFSWRVMIAEKTAHARYRWVHADGRRSEVDVAAYLTPWQAHVVPAQPDLLRRFLALLREEARGRGEEVEAEVEVSLNGRPARPFAVGPTD
jgi:vitamin K-dependent gamma-carboxylase